MLKRAALVFCFCLATVAIFANASTNAKKYYCSPEQVEITEASILIQTKDGEFELDALQVDQGGLYFTDESLRCPDCRKPFAPKDLRNICEYSACKGCNK